LRSQPPMHPLPGGHDDEFRRTRPGAGRTAGCEREACLPCSPAPAKRVRGLPLPALRALPRDGALSYAIVVMDDHGRITDRSVLRALGWSAVSTDDVLVHLVPCGFIAGGDGWFAEFSLTDCWYVQAFTRGSPCSFPIRATAVGGCG
jgi:hypothetical protein